MPGCNRDGIACKAKDRYHVALHVKSLLTPTTGTDQIQVDFLFLQAYFVEVPSRVVKSVNSN